MANSEFTNIIQGLYNAKVASLPLWMDGEFWRYDQIDPWHDDALRIEREACRGVVAAIHVGHLEPDQPGAAERLLALKLEAQQARREAHASERRRRRPLSQLAEAERRVRRSLNSRFRPRRPSSWSAPHPVSDVGVQMWREYGEVLASDGVELIHAPEACRVADADLYRGNVYTDESGCRWRFDGRDWIRT